MCRPNPGRCLEFEPSYDAEMNLVTFQFRLQLTLLVLQQSFAPWHYRLVTETKTIPVAQGHPFTTQGSHGVPHDR
jgi:hypothetical protein